MKRATIVIVAIVAGMGAAPVALGTDDLTSLSYISYLERRATVSPAHQDEVIEAVVNLPVVAGDRLETFRGARVELQLADGSTLWLDEFTVVEVDAVAGSRDDPAPRTALFLAQGNVAVEIPGHASGNESMRLDSEFGSLFLDKPGLFRIDLERGAVRVQAHAGLAELPAGTGSVLLRAGQQGWVDGRGGVDKEPLRASLDDFWAWVEARRRPPVSSTTQEHVRGTAASRAWVLDSYGEWVFVSSYSSWMWRPRVAVGWVPYSYGRWYWTPVGWTWVSYEPWGWLPYHYGTWFWDVTFGWVWGWDPIWGPAWVHWFYYPGYVGWCPRGYYDGWYYRHCRDCRHTHGHEPQRWHSATLDFSGRVRIRTIDPRPWTIVRSEVFTSGRLDRVRIEPTRLLREVPDDAFAHVRSGPLLTPTPGRGNGGTLLERSFTPGQRELPDLSVLMGRDSGAVGRLQTLPARPLRTADIELPARTVPAGRTGSTPALPSGSGAGRSVSGGTRSPGAVTPPAGRGGSTPSGTGSVRTPIRPAPDTPTGRGWTGTTPPSTVPDRPSPPSRPDAPRTVRSQPAPSAPPPVGRHDADPPQRPTTPNSTPPRREPPSNPPPPPPSIAESRRLPSRAPAPREPGTRVESRQLPPSRERLESSSSSSPHAGSLAPRTGIVSPSFPPAATGRPARPPVTTSPPSTTSTRTSPPRAERGSSTGHASGTAPAPRSHPHKP